MFLSAKRFGGAALAAAVLLAVWGTPGQAADEETGIRITESGVGTQVVNHELRGRGDAFPEGSQVCFWTRVVGGKAGDRIVHVWIHDGKEVTTVGLAVGGPHWRTYSRKTLHPGSTGTWKVEARTEDGKVLASASFTCTPAS